MPPSCRGRQARPLPDSRPRAPQAAASAAARGWRRGEPHPARGVDPRRRRRGQVVVDNYRGPIAVIAARGDRVEVVIGETVSGRTPEKLAEARAAGEARRHGAARRRRAPRRRRPLPRAATAARGAGTTAGAAGSARASKVVYAFELRVPYGADARARDRRRRRRAGGRRPRRASRCATSTATSCSSGMGGAGEARTVNGAAARQLRRPTRAAPAEFETVNGEVDVAFRAGLDADLRFKTMNGEAFTEFDYETRSLAVPAGDRRKGRFVLQQRRRLRHPHRRRRARARLRHHQRQHPGPQSGPVGETMRRVTLAAFAACDSDDRRSPPPRRRGQVERFNVPLTDPGGRCSCEVGLVSGGITVEAGGGNQVVVEARPATTTARATASREVRERHAAHPPLRLQALDRGGGQRRGDRLLADGGGLPHHPGAGADLGQALDRQRRRHQGQRRARRPRDLQHQRRDPRPRRGIGRRPHDQRRGQGGALRGRAGKAMAFSSLNGNVDVTLPGGTKADLRMESENGEIYTDFDVARASARRRRRASGRAAATS